MRVHQQNTHLNEFTGLFLFPSPLFFQFYPFPKRFENLSKIITIITLKSNENIQNSPFFLNSTTKHFNFC